MRQSHSCIRDLYGFMANRFNWIAAGVLFALLWASASTATKIGLVHAQPFVIADIRFALAAVIMLFLAHVIWRKRLPHGKEWSQLVIYGFLNITVYLGFYVIAMQYITAGIGALSVAINPIFISVLSIPLLKQKLKLHVIVGLVVCTVGVLCSAWPLFQHQLVTSKGLILLFISMLSYSLAAIYIANQKISGLHLFALNGWQTLFGGLLLLPVTLVTYKTEHNHYTLSFWGAVGWLAIPVSIFAVQLWLWLLRVNAVRASLWLFLCPIFGFAIAAWLMKDKIDIYTIVGVILVLLGLFLSQKKV
ncbi:MAG: DMT family transporter [Candidatus Dadabacteria bacterium]